MGRDNGTEFPHHRLDAYRVALELAVGVRAIADRIPRGHRSLADQMQRASMSTVLLIAEGANRRGAGEKRHRFSLARGECAECAAAVELAAALGVTPDAEAKQAQLLAGRVAAMLTRLIQRWS